MYLYFLAPSFKSSKCCFLGPFTYTTMFSHTAILQIRYRTVCKISIPLSTNVHTCTRTNTYTHTVHTCTLFTHAHCSHTHTLFTHTHTHCSHTHAHIYCSAFIITYSDKSEQICVVINIRQTFEGVDKPSKVKNHIRLCTRSYTYVHMYAMCRVNCLNKLLVQYTVNCQ